jgi:hypothetical protein
LKPFQIVEWNEQALLLSWVEIEPRKINKNLWTCLSDMIWGIFRFDKIQKTSPYDVGFDSVMLNTWKFLKNDLFYWKNEYFKFNSFLTSFIFDDIQILQVKCYNFLPGFHTWRMCTSAYWCPRARKFHTWRNRPLCLLASNL